MRTQRPRKRPSVPVSRAVAAYVRVSSKAQTLKTQRDAINRAATARGATITEWYAERVSSRNDRPELTRLKNDVRAGRFAKLFVFKLDRLSRGTICEMLNLMNEFKANGCEVESVADNLPFHGPFREMIISAIALCASMEREAIQDRVAAARLRVEASGGTWGRPRRMTPELLERAQSMRNKHIPVCTIARRLGVSRPTVYRALRRG